MADSPVISIVTVVMNDAEGLRRTAESLVPQKRAEVEWIVVDGASTDGTLDVIAARGAHVDVSVSERDAGIYDAMHKGVRLASGRYVYFLNAGDELVAGALDAILAAAGEAPDDAVLCGGWHCLEPDGDGPLLRPRPEALERIMSISHQASLLPRSVFSEGGGFDLRYTLSADYELFLRLRLAGTPFVRVPAPLVRYYRGGLSDRRIIRSRLESVRALWANRSPGRVAGTWHYAKELTRHFARPLWRRLFPRSPARSDGLSRN